MGKTLHASKKSETQYRHLKKGVLDRHGTKFGSTKHHRKRIETLTRMAGSLVLTESGMHNIKGAFTIRDLIQKAVAEDILNRPHPTQIGWAKSTGTYEIVARLWLEACIRDDSRVYFEGDLRDLGHNTQTGEASSQIALTLTAMGLTARAEEYLAHFNCEPTEEQPYKIQYSIRALSDLDNENRFKRLMQQYKSALTEITFCDPECEPNLQAMILTTKNLYAPTHTLGQPDNSVTVVSSIVFNTFHQKVIQDINEFVVDYNRGRAPAQQLPALVSNSNDVNVFTFLKQIQLIVDQKNKK